MSRAVLLTGSTGYIGQHLAHLHQRCGVEVIEATRSNHCDLGVSGWTKHLPARCVDVVVHLAQSKWHREFPPGAWDMFQVNLASTFELLEWARDHGVKRFIFASTGNVYKASTTKLTETAECEPVSMYAATKFSAEKLLRPYAVFFEVLTARLFTIYGPGQNGMLIPTMVERVRADLEITMAGGVGLFVTPLFITDCVRALVSLIDVPLAERLQTINLAGDEVIGLADIVGEIGLILGKSPVVKVIESEPSYFCGDNARLKHITGISDLVPFKAGIRRTLAQSAPDEFGISAAVRRL